MKIEIPSGIPDTLYPVTRDLGSLAVGGKSIARHLIEVFADATGRRLTVAPFFRPSPELVSLVGNCCGSLVVRDPADGVELLRLTAPAAAVPDELPPDAASWRIRYPWDLLRFNEEVVGTLAADEILGTVRDGVTIDGHIRLGRGSVLLPGVYIEGNAVFGENCKIGPNCYIRGNTSIGDNCHIGQAVEIKNSLLLNCVSIGHLSYVGDSVICDRVNFGAGTIVSNLRHDGASHHWRCRGELLDTGRRKFGAVIGENVHTGIHTAIYPGRMLPPGRCTQPGEIVAR